ncbi:M20 metallopeptidase family protein [Terrilactibacillus laevilacticus]|uniref:M20 metallopeptidase family protein n=1 Tax=Terrilactibacillus laevilacticus TaxID=1380157 RepID=UPI001C683CD2|nr:M20 family metallopeptidase [Terrilactibacillus laevilacticus]
MNETISSDVLQEAKDIQEWVISLRKKFHRHPELSNEEYWTSGVVAEELEKLGIKTERVGETGIIGVLEGKNRDKIIALRADMDALPVLEQTGLPFASEYPGKMHACGHDNHMSMLLGAARLLSERKDQLNGTVKFLFQPAEEVAEGAKRLIEAGALDDVDYCIGTHIWSDIPVGQVVMPKGPFMASGDTWDLSIKGASSHGSAPWQGRDAIVCAAAIIQGLQTIPSRINDVRSPIVLNIGTITGGERFNITPGNAKLDGMNRTFDAKIRKRLPEHMERVIKNICAGYDCEYEFNYHFKTGVTANESKHTELAQQAVRKIVGPDNLVPWEKIMGSEDFSAYGEVVPSTFMLLGCRNEEKDCIYSQHSERYNVDEDALPIGVASFVQIVEEYFA